MDELTKLLSHIELVADDIIDTKQQIVNFDIKRNKSREALNRLKELKGPGSFANAKQHWVCVGDMFIRLNTNDTRNLILEENYQTEIGVAKLHDEIKEKVNKLRQLEGQPEVSGLTLKPLSKKEIQSLRTAFKV